MKRLQLFWEKHPQAEQPLRKWYKIADKTDWTDIAGVRKSFPHADAARLPRGPTVTVFNIRGNHVRLVVTIDYKFGRVYVKQGMTHKEYNLQRWKVTLCDE